MNISIHHMVVKYNKNSDETKNKRKKYIKYNSNAMSIYYSVTNVYNGLITRRSQHNKACA